MPAGVALDETLEAFVQSQLATGRYRDADEVVRAALRLMRERERRLAELDAAITRGIADGEAGRVYDPDTVAEELDKELADLP